MALIHFTRELDRRFARSDNLKSYSLHPGGKSGTYTNVANKGLESHAIIGLLRKLAAPIERLFMATADEGAQTQIHCAVSAEVSSGHYYVNCQITEASADSENKSTAARLRQDANDWLGEIPE